MSGKGIKTIKVLIIVSMILAVLTIVILLGLKEYLGCGEVRIPVEIRFQDLK